MNRQGWRDSCPHVVECESEAECDAHIERGENLTFPVDAATKNETNTANGEEQMAPKKKTEETAEVTELRAQVKSLREQLDEQLDADTQSYRAQRNEERALFRAGASALLSLAAEQTKTQRAERIAHYADALSKLGDFDAPALGEVKTALTAELTVLARELRAERIAPPVVEKAQ